MAEKLAAITQSVVQVCFLFSIKKSPKAPSMHSSTPSLKRGRRSRKEGGAGRGGREDTYQEGRENPANQSFIINKKIQLVALNRDQCGYRPDGWIAEKHFTFASVSLASCLTYRFAICFVNKASGGAGLSLKFH